MQTVPFAGANGMCCNPTSSDTVCILNALAATRAEIVAASLQSTGQALISRINMLMMEELNFRQALASSTTIPNTALMGTRLQNMAVALTQDIAAYNQSLALIPADQRPFLARDLSNFDSVYWTPAMQRFACYNTQFQQNVATVYQPLYGQFSWLQCWQSNYQTSLNNIALAPQTFSCARWWCNTAPVVLGSTEAYPCATCGTGMPYGTAVYMPAAASTCNTCNTCGTCQAIPPCPTCSMGMMTVCPVNTPAPAPAAAPVPAPAPVTRGAD